MPPADDGDRDRLADECALLADECADLRDLVHWLRERLETRERELASARREIVALELERDDLARTAPAIEAGTSSGEQERSGALVLVVDGGEPRHYLLGHTVQVGDVLELCTIDGGWIAGRYMWSFAEAERPTLCGAIIGAEIPIGDRARLRWPSRGEGADMIG